MPWLGAGRARQGKVRHYAAWCRRYVNRALWLAIIFRQELQVTPWETIQYLVVRRAAEQRDIGIRFAERRVRLWILYTHGNCARLVPHYEAIFLRCLCNDLGD